MNPDSIPRIVLFLPVISTLVTVVAVMALVVFWAKVVRKAYPSMMLSVVAVFLVHGGVCTWAFGTLEGVW